MVKRQNSAEYDVHQEQSVSQSSRWEKNQMDTRDVADTRRHQCVQVPFILPK